MAIIHALSRETIDRIAAGEVVERPASLLKELIENALDAGATRIGLELSGGGIEMLRLSDDGAGIAAEDLPAALERHATSKIRELDDIEGVATFGFRGEALASIASVATLEIISRVPGEPSAWMLRARDGEVPALRPSTREPGTTVTVRDLFARVPVRKKFLKSAAGEKRQVMRIWERYLLSHPEVAFRLVDEDREAIQFASTTLRERVADVLGAGLARQMVEVSAEEDGYRLEGLTTLPLTRRGNRAQQFLFLGRRPIVDDRLRHAIAHAYRDVLPPGRHPSCLLFLEMDGSLVDVNVHPAKREVRFREPARVHELVRHSLERAISGGGLGGRLAESPSLQLGDMKASGAHPSPERDEGFPGTSRAAGFFRSMADPISVDGVREGSSPARESRNSEFWQVENTFIVTRIGGGLVIVDQHNAHERILYDRAVENLGGRAPTSQKLLFPFNLELSPAEMEAWRMLRGFFERLGFSMEEFGPAAVAVEAIPETLRRWDEGKAIRDILADSLEEKSGGAKRERALATYACKSAIKAGQPLREDEMRSLVSELFETHSPYTCPHGRPVVLRIGREELERRFHRSVPEGARERE